MFTNRQNQSQSQINSISKSSVSQALQQLLQQFNKIDIKKHGSIKLSQAIKLIKSSLAKIIKKNKNLQTLNISSANINFQNIMPRVILNHENQVTFDEFLAILFEVQTDLEINESSTNQRIIEFLHLLEDYRKKCEDATQYLQAQKAHHKILQIKNKQMRRHKQKLLYQQKGKVSSISNLQQSKITQFNAAWNQYMQKYEDAAISSIEKLKAKHLREMEEEEARIRMHYDHYLKPSKKIIDLKAKEKSLVKQKQYQQAQRIKEYANRLISKQRESKTQEINERIEKRKELLKKHQQIALLAHLKRIEKDRNEQLKQRQNDSQKMVMKLKNIQNDIVQKQSNQIRQTLDNLRGTMSLTSSQIFGMKQKMKSLEKLQKSRTLVMNNTEDNITLDEKGHKQKTSFKIRVNSLHRVKKDYSLYDP